MSAANRRHRPNRQMLLCQPLALLALLASLPHAAHAIDGSDGIRLQRLADNALAQIGTKPKATPKRIDGAALADQALGPLPPKAQVSFPDRDGVPQKPARWSNITDQALDQLKPLPPARPAARNASVQINKVLLPPPVTRIQPSFAIAEPPAAAPTTVAAAPVAAVSVTPTQITPTVITPHPSAAPSAAVAVAAQPVPPVAIAPALPITTPAPATQTTAGTITAEPSAAPEQNFARPAAPVPSIVAEPIPALPRETIAAQQPSVSTAPAAAPATDSAPIAAPQQAAEKVKLAAMPVAMVETAAATKPVTIIPPPIIAPIALRPVALLNGPRTLPPAAAKPSADDKPVASFAVIKTPAAKAVTPRKINNRKLTNDALAKVEPTVQHTQPEAPLNFTGLTGNAAAPEHKPEPATAELGSVDPKPHIDTPAAEAASTTQPADLKQELWKEWNEKLGLLEQENNALRAKLGSHEQDPLQDIRVDAVANIREKVLRERIAELEKELIAAQNKAKDTTLQNAAKDAASNALAKPPAPPPPGAMDLGVKDSATKPLTK